MDYQDPNAAKASDDDAAADDVTETTEEGDSPKVKDPEAVEVSDAAGDGFEAGVDGDGDVAPADGADEEAADPMV